jgi:Rrf2 family protein
MRVSRKCEYALRALLELSKRAEQGPVRIEEIARRQAIPRNFLANLLVQLKRGGFVRSKKGPEGGYYLGRPARQISVGEVVRFIDGSIAPIPCVGEGSGDRCEIAGRCGYLPLWRRLRDAVAEIVDGTTIGDVAEEERKLAAGREKVLMYHI